MEDVNNIIEELTNIIISLRQEKDKELCCYPKSQYDGSCIHNCKECTDGYYKKMKSDMMQKYGINV